MTPRSRLENGLPAPDRAISSFPDVRFLVSAPGLAQFPLDVGAEVAFAGRSNSGKSTAINAIVGRRGLARTSATPGRTQLVNFFELAPDRRLVDLPGYGYARVPVPVRRRWLRLLDSYFGHRQSLRGLFLLLDVRRAFNDADRRLIGWAVARGCPLEVLLTKSDKLGRASAGRALAKARGELGTGARASLFSALSGTGVAGARARLAGWLDMEPAGG